MKKLTALSLALFAGMIFTGLQAQTLDEVLDSYFETINQKKILEVNTVAASARILQMGMELPMEMKMKKPGKIRMEMTIQGQQMVTAFDGTEGWMIAPWMGTGVQDLPADQLKEVKEQADFEGPLWNYAEKGHQAEFLGKQDMEGTPTFVVQLTKKNGDINVFYMDADTYILLKQVTKTTVNGMPVESEQIFGNYQMFDGMPFAMSIETRAMGQSAQIVFDKIEYDVEIDDSIFTRPEQ